MSSVSDGRREAVCQWYIDHPSVSIMATAAHFGVSHHSVRKWLRVRGIPTRLDYTRRHTRHRKHVFLTREEIDEVKQHPEIPALVLARRLLVSKTTIKRIRNATN